MTVAGQSLQVLCRRARCDVRFDPKTDLTPIPNPVAIYPLRTFHSGDSAASFDYLVRQNEPSFILMLVQGGSVPKAIEFFFDRPADVPRA
jgi:hypothetical protein